MESSLRWILLGVGAIVLIVIYLVSRPNRSRRRDDRTDLLDEANELERAGLQFRAPQKSDDPSLDELRSELRELSGALREEKARPPSAATAPERPQPPQHEEPPPAPVEPEPEPEPGIPAAETEAPPEAAPVRDEPAPETPVAEPPPEEIPDLLIVMHIAAPAGERFTGSDLLEAMFAEGLEFGDMDIFHRYARVGDAREPVFSVANAIKPGTLIPEDMPTLETPGVSLFLRLPGVVSAEAAFADLQMTAESLAERLGGVVQDETRSAFTPQTREHLRERVEAWVVKYERLPSD